MASKVIATRALSADKAEVLQRGADGKLVVKVVPLSTSSGCSKSGKIKSPLVWLRDEAVRLLMPTVYPPSFVTYCKWQFLQTITGQVAGILAMQAVLSTVGLGASTPTQPPVSGPMNATVTGNATMADPTSSTLFSIISSFIASLFSFSLAASARLVIKDLLGQLGGVIYGAVLSARFDTDAKRQRFLATIVEMVSNLMELMTPFYPSFFLIMAGIANMGKNISMMATGATRAQMHLSFVVDNNLGDITAKITSQTMGACFFGMGLGVIITQYTANSIVWQMLAFVILASVCLWACVQSNYAVEFKSLNYERAELLAFHTLKHVANTRDLSDVDLSTASRVEVLTPTDIPRREHVVFPFTSAFSIPLEWDAPFSELRDQEVYVFDGYAIQATKTLVRLWVSKDATDEQAFFGYIHACALRFDLPSRQTRDVPVMVQDTKNFADSFVSVFRTSLKEVGWELENFAADKTRSLTL